MTESLSNNQMPKVLVVDDDLAGLLMASEALSAAGFEVIEAEDGQEAIEQFDAHSPDIVVMDVVMPRMNGFETVSYTHLTLPTNREV